MRPNEDVEAQQQTKGEKIHIKPLNIDVGAQTQVHITLQLTQQSSCHMHMLRLLASGRLSSWII